MKAVWFGLGLLLATPQSLLAETPPDALAWLQKIAAAARQLNYTGTFVYQYGNHVETSRIIHLVDQSGEHEKLESLDGSPREVIRDNDEVRCYFSDSKTVKVEKRSARKAFPALLPAQFTSLTENYVIKKGGQERIAGFDCQALILEPKDGLRYGHKLWADVNSGLLLKATTLNEKNQVVEQIAFTQLNIGGAIDKEMLKPKFSAPDWRMNRSPSAESKPSETGWLVKNQPLGFKKIMEMKRTVAGKTAPMTHIVFSDGLAAVSVFIEPMPAKMTPAQGLSNQGAINVYTRPVAEHMVTVLGEAPPVTVMQIGNSVSYKGR